MLNWSKITLRHSVHKEYIRNKLDESVGYTNVSRNFMTKIYLSILLLFITTCTIYSQKLLEANMSSIGTPSYSGTDKSLLTKKITVLTQSNSELPWNLNRAITTDQNNNIRKETDNCIVELSNEKWIV